MERESVLTRHTRDLPAYGARLLRPSSGSPPIGVRHPNPPPGGSVARSSLPRTLKAACKTYSPDISENRRSSIQSKANAVAGANLFDGQAALGRRHEFQLKRMADLLCKHGLPGLSLGIRCRRSRNQIVPPHVSPAEPSTLSFAKARVRTQLWERGLLSERCSLSCSTFYVQLTMLEK
eukprot:1181898-Prorocentrum_minimum.AAC.4